jgi:crotonobetainyl-CoA:carnitine CoA-transferase CaiB-like acyl-CoA transferase
VTAYPDAPTPRTAAPASGPLSGIRVIDASTVLAGPLCCQVLGDFGADVVKVEHPSGGDALRTHGAQKDGIGLWWTMVARNKRTLGLYLGDPDGAEVFKELVRTSDVLVENFRPGTLERWGLGPDVLLEVNPRLVLVRVTGFGQTGPYAARPGFGTLAEAMSGFAAITGEPDGPPTLPPFGLADSVAGLSAAISAVLGLFHRDAGPTGPHPGSGRGQVVDVAILEPIVTILGSQPSVLQQTGVAQGREGNRSRNNAPRNAYRTSDGQWVAVSASALRVAQRIMRLVGHPETAQAPWFRSGAQRAEHRSEVDDVVAAWIAQRPAAEVIAAFTEAEAAIAPIYDVAGLMADEHAVARNMFPTIEHPVLGPVAQQGVLFHLSETPGQLRWAGRSIGEDTDDILVTDLDMDPSRVAALRERGIVA